MILFCCLVTLRIRRKSVGRVSFDTGNNRMLGWKKKTVTGHFVPRSFRTQVSSWHFGHFVPTFNLVISYPVWSFRTYFVPSLVISYLLLLFSRQPFWSFRTYFLLFRTQVISNPNSLCTHFNHFVLRSFRIHFQTGYELTGTK